MIPGFEKETCPLTETEKKLVPVIIKGLHSKIGEENAIYGADICSKMNLAGYSITEPRLRKIVNFIRSEAILPIIATSKGYYVSHDTKVIKLQIESLKKRKEAIEVSLNGLQNYLNKITNG